MQFVSPGLASVIVGGQFGSEAKGLAAAYLSGTIPSAQPLICTTNAGAQAGHTTILADGTKFVCYHLPTIGVMNRDAMIYLNAGSIIDPVLLAKEIKAVCAATGEPENYLINRLFIHPQAAVIRDEDKVLEAGGGTTHLGSTMKGVGAALTRKIMRQPGSVAYDCGDLYEKYRVTVIPLMEEMSNGFNRAVTVEIPQGTGLSMNNGGFFPKCTSRDCWVGQGLTDAGINPFYLGKVAMVVRTFPIRVGHVFNDEGQKIGDSGPFYSDGRELSWEDDFPGIEPERTTVTQRVRRIANWSWAQYKYGLRLNRPEIVFLTFTNYLGDAEELVRRVHLMHKCEMEILGRVCEHVYSWGPKVSDCSTILDDALAYWKE